MVYVVLVVPRSKLGVFDEPLESTGTPGLHISVSQQGMFENSFFGIDCCFGQLKVVPNSVGVFVTWKKIKKDGKATEIYSPSALSQCSLCLLDLAEESALPLL